MVALKHYKEHVKAAVAAGADVIISGAGLPMNLPEHRKNATRANWNGFQKKSWEISTCGLATISLIN